MSIPSDSATYLCIYVVFFSWVGYVNAHYSMRLRFARYYCNGHMNRVSQLCSRWQVKAGIQEIVTTLRWLFVRYCCKIYVAVGFARPVE